MKSEQGSFDVAPQCSNHGWVWHQMCIAERTLCLHVVHTAALVHKI